MMAWWVKTWGNWVLERGIVLHIILRGNLVRWGMITDWMMVGNRVSGVISSWVRLWRHVLVGTEGWSRIVACLWLIGVLDLVIWWRRLCDTAGNRRGLIDDLGVWCMCDPWWGLELRAVGNNISP